MKQYSNIYMVGIGGVGMASLAVLLKQMGKRVSGVDAKDFHTTDKLLDQHGISYERGFDPDHITYAYDVVVTTGAHGGLENPEVLQAKDMGIPVLTHAEAAGMVMDASKIGISVCGTHGKTTTSGMTAVVLDELGASFSHLVGSIDVSGLPGGRYDGDEYCVIEADEYVTSKGVDDTPRFMHQHPDYVICTNIDHDHVDVYETLDDVKKAFKKFFENLQENEGTLVYCYDDPHLRSVVQELGGLSTISYGFDDNADYVLRPGDSKKAKKGIFEYVLYNGDEEYHVNLSVPGTHNMRNSASVIILMQELGLDIGEAIDAISHFRGTKLRMEIAGESSENTLIVDYAHHPTEIEATLDAIHMKYPERRVITVFQPHTYSRTETLKNAFIQALKEADEVVLVDIYASAREKQGTITSQDVVNEAVEQGCQFTYVSDDKVAKHLKDTVKSGDVIAIMGAGDFYSKYGEDIMTALSLK